MSYQYTMNDLIKCANKCDINKQILYTHITRKFDMIENSEENIKVCIDLFEQLSEITAKECTDNSYIMMHGNNVCLNINSIDRNLKDMSIDLKDLLSFKIYYNNGSYYDINKRWYIILSSILAAMIPKKENSELKVRMFDRNLKCETDYNSGLLIEVNNNIVIKMIDHKNLVACGVYDENNNTIRNMTDEEIKIATNYGLVVES